MKSNQDDLISVVIPFYNEKKYFSNCINSVLAQTYKNLEIIIINDGSDPEYLETLENLKNKYPEKIFLYHKENEGVSSARNLGIQKSKGKYISFLDSDDEWLPNKIEHQINILKEKKLNFIHGSYFLVDEEFNLKGKFIANDLNYKDLLKSCNIGLSTVIVKADIAKKYLFPKISTKEDYICWLNIIKELNYLVCDTQAVSIYRKRKESLSSKFIVKFINAFKVYYIYESFGFLKSCYYTLRLSIYYLIKENLIRNKNLYPISFNYIIDFKKINFEKSFILVALNMASLSYMNILYENAKNIIFWLDGVCAKFIIKNYIKTAGRKVIKKLSLPENIHNVYLLGKYSDKQINYIDNTLNRKVEFIELPFFNNLYEAARFKLNLKDSSLVLINIATPKQEIIAKNLLKNNSSKKIFVLCLGGGIAMAAGEEKIVPEFIEKLNLEWLWRLKSDTLFRLKRLIRTASFFLFKKIFKYFNKIKFRELV